MINWTELFDMQRELDERIIQEKGITGDTLPWRVTAFLVELAEFANEARFFKMWSDDREPRNDSTCPTCQGRGFWFNGPRVMCKRCKETGKIASPLLEEFVDALHFAVGIGLTMGMDSFDVCPSNVTKAGLSNSYIECVSSMCEAYYANMAGYDAAIQCVQNCVQMLFMLGYSFGLTDEEIIAAYKAKHAENHARQDRGY